MGESREIEMSKDLRKWIWMGIGVDGGA